VTTYGPRPPRVEAVIRSACNAFLIERDELLEGSRRKSVTEARADICRKLRSMKFTLDRIGLYLNVTHSAVHVAIYGKRNSREHWEGPVTYPDLSGEWAI
jgi:hypothetical protein